MASTVTLAGYAFAKNPKSVFKDHATGRVTEVYPAVRNSGTPIGIIVKSVVTVVAGGVRSTAIDSDTANDYNGLQWTMPKGAKRASFCIAGGATEADCALNKLAEVHQALSQECLAAFGSHAAPFFKASDSGEFSYFDFAIWKDTAVSDEPKVRSFGGGAVKVGDFKIQPLPARWRLLGFTAFPSHITVTTMPKEPSLVRIHFRAAFLAGGTRDDLDLAKIPYPTAEGYEADDEGGDVGKSYAGVSLSDLTEDAPDTLPMEEGVAIPETQQTPPAKLCPSSSIVEKKSPPGVKRPIAKKSH